jgi:hypothetical protein
MRSEKTPTQHRQHRQLYTAKSKLQRSKLINPTRDTNSSNTECGFRRCNAIIIGMITVMVVIVIVVAIVGAATVVARIIDRRHRIDLRGCH